MLSLTSRFGRQVAQRPAFGVRPFATTYIKDSAVAREKLTDPNGLKVISWTATWCGPCKSIAPLLEKMSDDHSNVSFYKIDVDDCADVAQEAGVNSMPTFHFISNDEVVDQLIGANPDSLQQKLAKLIE